MSSKYLWNDDDLNAEQDFNKAFQIIIDRYVQKNI